MPPRKWHTKSRLGCLQCKQRHVKCGEERPVCSNCSKNNTTCTWPVRPREGTSSRSEAEEPAASQLGASEPSEQALPLAQPTQRKKWHQKSQNGCFMCRSRRVKCDEVAPICSACARAGAECRYPSQEDPGGGPPEPAPFPPPPPSSSTAPDMLSVVRPTSTIEDTAFKYFELTILPSFKDCQPSLIWDQAMGYSRHTHSTLRHIAIALGFQKGLSDGAIDDLTCPPLTSTAQSDLFYSQAISSLKETMRTTSLADAPQLALCCLFLVALEGLRSSPENILLHLRSGVNIIAQAIQDDGLPSLDEFYTLGKLLQSLCLNSLVYSTSPALESDETEVLEDIFYSEVSISDTSEDQIITLEKIHTFVSELARTRSRYDHAISTPQDRSLLLERLNRLRSEAANIRRALLLHDPSVFGRGSNEAKVLTMTSFVTLIYPEDKDGTIRRILYLLEHLIGASQSTKVPVTGPASPPVVVGAEMAHVLDVIVRHANNAALEQRARELRASITIESAWHR